MGKSNINFKACFAVYFITSAFSFSKNAQSSSFSDVINSFFQQKRIISQDEVIKSLEEQIKYLQSQVNIARDSGASIELQTQLVLTEQEKNTLELQYRGLSTDLAVLRQSIDVLREENAGLRERIALLSAMNTSNQDEREIMIASHKANIEALCRTHNNEIALLKKEPEMVREEALSDSFTDMSMLSIGSILKEMPHDQRGDALKTASVLIKIDGKAIPINPDMFRGFLLSEFSTNFLPPHL
ncbi:MAG: hypothetical protein ACK5XN_06395 [Bacteroidota bacterium]